MISNHFKSSLSLINLVAYTFRHVYTRKQHRVTHRNAYLLVQTQVLTQSKRKPSDLRPYPNLTIRKDFNNPKYLGFENEK